MITAHDGKYPARVGKLPLFYILDPGPIDPDGDIMLCFTSNRAGMAPDAVAIVDDESKIQVIFIIRVFKFIFFLKIKSNKKIRIKIIHSSYRLI